VAVAIGPGNENERAHLLPLVDELTHAGYDITEVWADRGYDGLTLRDSLAQRDITAMISPRRKRGKAGQPHHPPKRDPLARKRWVIERTNAWIKRFRRISTRHEPDSRVYLAYLTLALLIILNRNL
jgi:transposase